MTTTEPLIRISFIYVLFYVLYLLLPLVFLFGLPGLIVVIGPYILLHSIYFFRFRKGIVSREVFLHFLFSTSYLALCVYAVLLEMFAILVIPFVMIQIIPYVIFIIRTKRFRLINQPFPLKFGLFMALTIPILVPILLTLLNQAERNLH